MSKKDKCPICGTRTFKMVPFADSDQRHEGKMTCVKCKQKAKKIVETGENDLRNVEVAQNE